MPKREAQLLFLLLRERVKVRDVDRREGNGRIEAGHVPGDELGGGSPEEVRNLHVAAGPQKVERNLCRGPLGSDARAEEEGDPSNPYGPGEDDDDDEYSMDDEVNDDDDAAAPAEELAEEPQQPEQGSPSSVVRGGASFHDLSSMMAEVDDANDEDPYGDDDFE